jgi:hypothetical protein
MSEKAAVFEENIQFYLDRMQHIDWQRHAAVLGAQTTETGLRLPFFDQSYFISSQGISDAAGRPAPYSVCIVLFKYILMAPSALPEMSGWAAYRDFPDAGPLLSYFAKNAEGALIRSFSGHLDGFAAACRKLGAVESSEISAYDLAMRFSALPRVPMLVLFNDADTEFAAHCSVLFDRSVAAFLDMESVAVLGSWLARQLNEYGNMHAVDDIKLGRHLS